MTETVARICILGGGFGGLYTALRLSQLSWDNGSRPEIVLIDKNDRFIFSPLLYELVTSEMQSWEVAPPFTELLAHTNIRFLQATVTGIDLNSSLVSLDNQEPINFDKLVIAMGGKSSLDFVQGARQYAIPFRTLEDAYRLNTRLQELENSPKEKIRVAVIGGGYSGVELACKVADRLGEKGRIRLIEKSGRILANSPDFNRKTAEKALEKRKIWIDADTTVEEITSDSMSLNYKGQVDNIPVDLVLWTVSPIVSDLIKDLPLEHGARNALAVNEYLQTINHPNIFVVGDIADSQDQDGKTIPATAQVAIQQSDYCAWNIWAGLRGKPLLSFRYQPLGEMLTLGTDEATVSSLGIQLEGGLAYLARRLVYLYRLPTLKHQLNVGFNWIAKPLFNL
ncbi:MAG: Demethylphylloquinone reductase NdbB [Chroococcopsis gigantea SAG 12.99]|jgi:NADH:ubiquinone reductase (non-electrogenic)|nr:Demethylphylloquinone reductase NdbB [Chroococcopsis gigantea SAG 12.99]